MLVKASLIQRAQELGFDACGVLRAESSAAAEHFQRWLDAGRHGEMTYLGRTAARRRDPKLVLDGVRSIVVLAASYHQDSRFTSSGAGKVARGLVARYARHLDYHEVLTRSLNSLVSLLHEAGGPGTQSLGYVDTGPLLERDLAERAGVGFIGKHTNLIRRNLGNWFVLAEVLTTLELEPDTPEKNHCGTCTRCMAACPTGAILAPFQLDARRCISYLTIELKGSIPEPLRPAVGRRVFGCDDCLEVCPWNRFAREGRLLREHRRPDLGELDLIELLSLDAEGFKRRFAGTPLLRAKRRGLVRNACVALGNVGSRDALPALTRAAADPDPLVVEHAQWAIHRIEVRECGAGLGSSAT